MIKECPTCKRTYSDQSITFCLADGSLLSAPFDPQATQHFPVSDRSEPRPAVVIRSSPRSDSLPLTLPAIEVNDALPTITSPNTLHIDKQHIVDSSATRPAVSWYIRILAMIAGLVVGFLLRSLIRVIFLSSTSKSYELFYILTPVVTSLAYGTVGSLWGFVWPRKAWRWGLWIVAIPWLYVVLLTLPLLGKSIANSTMWFVFTQVVLPPIAACVGSYLGSRLSSKGVVGNNNQPS